MADFRGKVGVLSYRNSVGMASFCSSVALGCVRRSAELPLVLGSTDIPIAVLNHPYIYVRSGSTLLGQLLFCFRLDEIWKSIRFFRLNWVSKVFIVSSHPANIIFMIVWAILGGEIVFHLHDPWPHSSQRGRSAVIVFNYLVSFLPRVRISVSSRFAAIRAVEASFRNSVDCFPIVNLPYSAKNFNVINEPGGIRNKIIMIGRIEAYKNPLEFIRIARLIGDISPFSFCLCGFPSDSRLEADLIAENHDNVVNLEFAVLSEDRFVSLISSARVVCLPYLDATDSGIAPICFALGAPIVAYSVGGLVDTISHGVNGYLVPPGDAIEFSNSVVRICSQDSLFEQLSSGAREASILHSPEGVYDSILRAFS